jgi:hypothetical protein
MEAIGRLFNILPVADDVYVPLKDCSAVTFVGVLTTGDTWTLTEAADAAGTGAAVLSTIDRYLVSATVGAVWQELTQAVGSAVTTTSSQDVIAIHVSGQELSDGKDWLKLASTSTGIVIAILHDLDVRRAPAKLAALV